MIGDLVSICVRVQDVLSLCGVSVRIVVIVFFFFQAEDGIRDLVRSRGLGDVYKRQGRGGPFVAGVYPLLFDDTCGFLAADFDGEDWDQDLSLIHI